MPYTLVRDHISRDTIESMKQILGAAEVGDVRGTIFGLMLKGRRYMVNIAGDALRDPTFARGMCGAIEDELRQIIQSQADKNTTI